MANRIELARLDVCSKQWNEDYVCQTRVQIVQERAGMAGVELAPPSRVATLYYMGVVLSKTVTNVEQEVNVKAACPWNYAALVWRQLPAFWVGADFI